MVTSPPFDLVGVGVYVLAGVVFLAGVVVIVVGRRGRRIDDHRVCRRCGFDLFGSGDDAARCPECGAGFAGKPRAVRVGNRARRPGAIALGVFLAFLGLAGLGGLAYRDVSGFDWHTIKPTSWLLRDAAANASAGPPFRNLDELRRRHAAGSLSPAETARLVAEALAVQGDRSYAWPRPWEETLDELLVAGLLTQADIATMLEQAFTSTVGIKPAIRRGRSVALRLRADVDRWPRSAHVTGDRRAEPTRIGDAVLYRGEFERTYNGRAGGGSYTTGFTAPRDLPLGEQTMRLALNHRLTLTQPVASSEVRFQRVLTARVRVVEEDGIVDEFVVDPAQASAVDAAWIDTRVESSPDGGAVWVQLDSPPMGLAMAVWVIQGDQERRAWDLRWRPGDHWGWAKFNTRRRGEPLAGEVRVELRPSQDPADGTTSLDTYWGGTLARDGVAVDAPYPPAFDDDLSVAKAMIAAVTLDDLRLDDTHDRGPRLEGSIDIHGAPRRAAFTTVTVLDGLRQTHDYPSPEAPAGYNHGYGMSLRLDAAEPPDRVDVLLLPDPEWEDRAEPAPPPWGYGLLFRDVPLPRASAGEPASVKVHADAVIDRAGDVVFEADAAE